MNISSENRKFVYLNDIVIEEFLEEFPSLKLFDIVSGIINISTYMYILVIIINILYYISIII